jgi:hypothetical protein
VPCPEERYDRLAVAVEHEPDDAAFALQSFVLSVLRLE